jgi:hypothetical protein
MYKKNGESSDDWGSFQLHGFVRVLDWFLPIV